MKKIIVILAIIAIYGAGCFEQESVSYNLTNSNMQILSSAFKQGEPIPSKYTCDGENISPPLNITEVPDVAISLVLLVDDPDVPKSIRPDGMWDHWVVFNMPSDVTEIFEGKNSSGRLGKNTGGDLAYGGPCPPDREHRYFFKLYALDIILELPEGATKTEVLKAMEGHIVDKAELMGTYDRER